MSVYLRPAKEFECGYTKTDLPEVPYVIISEKALKKMEHMVNLAEKEVGWFGTVSKETHKNRNYYLIDDVFLVEQKVHETTTEISPEGMASLVMDLMNQDNGDFEKRACRLMCWGHSHVNMEPLPSNQDEQQFADLINNNVPYMIRIICNKKGRLIVDVYEQDNAIIWTDIPWSIEKHHEGEDFIAEEMKRLVSELVIETKNSTLRNIPTSAPKIVRKMLNAIRRAHPRHYKELVATASAVIAKNENFDKKIHGMSLLTGLELAFPAIIGKNSIVNDLMFADKNNGLAEDDDED